MFSSFVMAPVYGWKPSGAKDGGQAIFISSQGDKISEDINNRLKKNFLITLCKRPSEGVTEVFRWIKQFTSFKSNTFPGEKRQ